MRRELITKNNISGHLWILKLYRVFQKYVWYLQLSYYFSQYTLYLSASIGPGCSLFPPLLWLAQALMNIRYKSQYNTSSNCFTLIISFKCRGQLAALWFIVPGYQALSSNLHIANNKIIDKIVAHKHFTMDCSLPYQCADAGGRY